MIFLNPNSIEEFDFGVFKLKMKPASKARMLEFLMNYPQAFNNLLLGGNLISGLIERKVEKAKNGKPKIVEDDKGFKNFLKLIADHIVEWSLSEEISAATLEKMNPIFLELVIGGFIKMNFLGESEIIFFENTAKQQEK